MIEYFKMLLLIDSPYATSPSAYSPALNSPAASPAYSMTSELRGTPGGGGGPGGSGTGYDLDRVAASEWVSENIHVLDRATGGQGIVIEIKVSTINYRENRSSGCNT